MDHLWTETPDYEEWDAATDHIEEHPIQAHDDASDPWTQAAWRLDGLL